jgi:sulfur carrier protein
MRIRFNGAWRELERCREPQAERELDREPKRAPDRGGQAGGRDDAGPSLAAVLEQLGYGQAHVATALNGEFVPARARAGVSVRDGDRLEVLAPMQGG